MPKKCGGNEKSHPCKVFKMEENNPCTTTYNKEQTNRCYAWCTTTGQRCFRLQREWGMQQLKKSRADAYKRYMCKQHGKKWQSTFATFKELDDKATWADWKREEHKENKDQSYLSCIIKTQKTEKDIIKVFKVDQGGL